MLGTQRHQLRGRTRRLLQRAPGPGQPPAPPAPAFARGALPPRRGVSAPAGSRAPTPSPAPVERSPAGEGGGTGGCAFPWVGFGKPSRLSLCLFLLHS